ncbi:MAG TPA: hypothetical protein VN914_19830 [Polyangia bacterium]|nr:hypothetical protein [Polyangia bacterium]
MASWGCGGSGPPAPPPVEPPLRLAAFPESVAIQPSQSKDVLFRLQTLIGAPVQGRVIQFSIVDDPGTPGDEAAGATLSFDRAVTDGDGAVTLQIIVGPTPTMFRVRASAPRAASLEVTVFVTTATLAPVELVPVLVDAPVPGQELTTVRLYVLDGDGCAGVRPDNLPTNTPFVRTIPSDSTALFSTVFTEQAHQLVALGLDAGGVARASGCVDLAGSLLLVDVPLRVVVPMHLFRASPQGRYDAVSELELGRGLVSGAQVIEAWREPGQCPLDPARLWLDCTIDALGSSDNDPLDCVPADHEGDLGDQLMARRGLLLPTPLAGRCRDKVDAAGRASLEALAAALWASPTPPLVSALPSLGDEAARLLDSLELHSTLTIERTSTPDRYQIDHRLTAASFPMASPNNIDLVGIGAPALEARFVTGTVREGELALGTHGFTLRLGSTARLAFARSSLVPRGGPADAADFVTALFGMATRNDNGTILTGCAALDALLCADLGSPRGCLATACSDGLTTLRQRLDAGFVAMDGDDLDFVLGGTAAVFDGDGDGQADGLGGPVEGIWSGEVRGRGGPSVLTGKWSAVRSF